MVAGLELDLAGNGFVMRRRMWSLGGVREVGDECEKDGAIDVESGSEGYVGVGQKLSKNG